jgi:hypothetical protein
MGKIDEAEAFFIDALEEWRKSKKIEKMTLMVLPPHPGITPMPFSMDQN